MVVVIHVCPKTKQIYVCNVYKISEYTFGSVLRRFQNCRKLLLGLSCLFLCLSVCMEQLGS